MMTVSAKINKQSKPSIIDLASFREMQRKQDNLHTEIETAIPPEMAQAIAEEIVKIVNNDNIIDNSCIAIAQIAYEIELLLGMVQFKKPTAQELIEYVKKMKSEGQLDEGQILANCPYDLSEFANVVCENTDNTPSSIIVTAGYKGELLNVTINPSTRGFIKLLNQLQKATTSNKKKASSNKAQGGKKSLNSDLLKQLLG